MITVSLFAGNELANYFSPCNAGSGSAIAITISFIVLPLGLIVYIRVRGLHRQTWDGWSWESLKGWKQFVGLAVPGLLMVVCEAWCFEISAVLTGAISEVQLGVNTVLIQLLANTFQVGIHVLVLFTFIFVYKHVHCNMSL